jgi:protein phosphatase/serine/threonine-protein phosphatase Stp1
MSGIDNSVAETGGFRSWAATHVGTVRKTNQDAYVNRPDLGLWAVADGAGGHDGGEIASGAVADALRSLDADLPAAETLVEVRTRLDAVHADLRAHSAEGRLCASTVVVLIARREHFACLWAGDSRAYVSRAGTLTRLTRDHSLVEELVETGAITPAEAEHHPRANVITRAVGSDAEALDLEKRTGTLAPGDRILLCSDGLCKTLPDPVLAAMLALDEDSPAERLVMAALAAGVTDNVTALTIEVLPDAR